MAGYSGDTFAPTGANSLSGNPVDIRGKRLEDLKPVATTKKDVGYVANSADSKMVYNITADTASATGDSLPNAVRVHNTGLIPVLVLLVYEEYTDANTDTGPATLQVLLNPGEEVRPHLRAAFVANGANPLRQLSGTVVDFTTTVGDGSKTFADFESDTGDNSASGEVNHTTDPLVFELDNGHEKYRVGDYLRIENEIVKVEGTYDDNPTAETVADNHIVVSRGHFGSTNATHSGTADINFHITNEYYDFDRVLHGRRQEIQTDMLGRWKSSNFFGYGRYDATADNLTFGLVPGSICFRFWSKAYQEIYMGGTGVAGGSLSSRGMGTFHITGSTDSKLATATAYTFNITIDDSSATAVTFTTDSSVTTFGGSSGIVRKMQDALNTASKTVGNALFGYTCTVAIKNGALCFTSNSNLSPHDGTNGSKILLEDGGSGTNLFDGAQGIFPDITQANIPVDPKLPDLYLYNKTTNAKTPNMEAYLHDDGYGNLIYKGNIVGSINYETGAHDFTISQLPNAEFEIACSHSSAFSGKLDNTKEDTTCLNAIHANILSKNGNGKLDITTY